MSVFLRAALCRSLLAARPLGVRVLPPPQRTLHGTAHQEPRHTAVKEKKEGAQIELNDDMEDVDMDANPTEQLDPVSYHPSGSNSEQIVAGERSPIDPLQDKREEDRKQEQRKEKQPKQKGRAPSLEDIDEGEPIGP